jgi:hypothetical protein
MKKEKKNEKVVSKTLLSLLILIIFLPLLIHGAEIYNEKKIFYMAF